MRRYLNTRICRRRFILEYLQDDFCSLNIAHDGCCDNCWKKTSQNFIPESQLYIELDDKGLIDLKVDADLVLRTVALLGNWYGINSIISYLMGTKNIPRHSSKFL